MKLNNTQIKALAQEVLNKIPETEPKFTKEQTINFSKIVAEFTKLEKENTALEDKMFSIKDNLRESNLFTGYLYDHDITDIKKLENKLLNKKPTLEEVIQKITLETIFETKDSMNDFIDNLVKQYSK
jgi:predicted RNase H-like nuclease (RuvC/YqgF family)